jgi:rod shape-determining protein MreD
MAMTGSDYREEFPQSTLKSNSAAYRGVTVAAIAVAAILFRVYVPRWNSYLSYLELPLLATIYFSLMRRSPLMGVFYGASIGLAQDSLSPDPLGMFGIVKTLVGYFAATAGLRFNVDSSGVRMVLTFFFYFFHQFFYWVLARALLSQMIGFDVPTTLIVAALNAVVAVPLFHVFDKLKVTE